MPHPSRSLPRPTRFRRVVVAVCAGLLATTMPFAQAATVADDPDAAKRSVDSELQALREQLHDTEGNLAAAYLSLRETEAQIPGAQAQLTQAEADVKAAEAADRQAAADLALAQANEKKAQEELDATTAEIAKGRDRVASFASQVYMEQGMGSFGAAVDAANPQQFADRMAMVGAVMDNQHSTLTRLATARASQTAQRAHVEALRVDSEKAKKKAEEAVAARRAARQAAADAKRALDSLASAQRAQAAAVQTQLEGEKAREASMQAESDRLAAVIKQRAEEARRAAAAAALRAQSTSGFMAWPMPGGYITSEFGYRIHPITGVSTIHEGRDLAAPCGTPVVAALDGTILSAGPAGGFGNHVVIDHGIQRGVPVATSYNHLQGIAVFGGSVRRGQVIGYEGTTGFSTGCHLHFMVYVDGTPVDPRAWM